MKVMRLAVKRPDVAGFLAERGAWLKAWVQSRLPIREAKAQPTTMLGGGELLGPVAVVLLLTLLVMGSAMAVILSAYEYRKLFNQHQVLVQQWDELQVEWGQYLLEQSVWSAHHRIEALAAAEMNMVVPETEAIEIVRYEQQ